MKKISKRAVTFLAAFFAVVSMLLATSISVWAASDSKQIVAYPDAGYQLLEYSPVKVSNVKSSNNSIVSAKAKVTDGGYMKYAVYVKAKKAGTATVSYKADGVTYKVKVTVKKYVNPIKSIKFGNTSISGSKFNKSRNVDLKYVKFANKKVKTTVTLKKGWKLEEFYFPKTGKNKQAIEYFPANGDGEGIAVVNGGKVTVKGGKGSNIVVSAVNEKTGLIEYIGLNLK